MKKIERIRRSIAKDKELSKRINSISCYSIDDFIKDALRYIKAIKEHRMINTIGHVTGSGMSRTIKFVELSKFPKGVTRYNVLQFWCLFKALGYTEARGDQGYFLIRGCGMDMIFHTNYNNIRTFYRLGFISKEICERLEQQTPTTI